MPAPSALDICESAMNSLLQTFLTRTIKTGQLEIIDSSGASFCFGDGMGVPVRVWFKSKAAERRVLLDPEIKLGEEYMNGGFDIEVGTVLDLLTLLRANVGGTGRTWWTTAHAALRRIVRRVVEKTIMDVPATTSEGTTILTGTSIRSFSTPTGNIRAPISKMASPISTKRNWPRNDTSRLSSICTRVRQYWISAPAGLVSASISLRRSTSMSLVSRSLRNSMLSELARRRVRPFGARSLSIEGLSRPE